MPNDWQQSKRWSDRFLPEIKRTLGEFLICESAAEEDAERNTDLMVLTLGAVRVGCRVRQWPYLEKYSREFTIRSGRPSGVKTELAKIIEGWGDYLFYGFANEEGNALAQWFIGDLNVFRLWHSTRLAKSGGCLPGAQMPNSDGSSHFVAYQVADLPDYFVVAKASRLAEAAA